MMDAAASGEAAAADLYDRLRSNSLLREEEVGLFMSAVMFATKSFIHAVDHPTPDFPPTSELREDLEVFCAFQRAMMLRSEEDFSR